jgi:hypothetical protein
MKVLSAMITITVLLILVIQAQDVSMTKLIVMIITNVLMTLVIAIQVV